MNSRGDGTCPLCGWSGVADVLHFASVPVFANVLFDSETEATSAPTGKLDLVVCERCGLLFNQAADPDLLAYSPAYENSLHHSAVFEQYATSLAERLVSTYELAGRDVIEIGPGNGDFLTMLVKAGVARGVGYDPSHDPAKAVVAPGVTIHADLYPDTLPKEAAAVTCRHVVEHLESPSVLLDVIRDSLALGDGAIVYLEVPDATYMVEQIALWDVIYEHITYSAEPTLRWACERAGLRVLDSGRSFGSQYLWVEAEAGTPSPDLEPPEPVAFVASARHFGREVGRLIEDWSARVSDLADDGPVAVWGAGSKGTSFLSMVPAAAAISHVVDVNPAKRGRFVPGSGHRIEQPEELDADLAHVIVMNPIYQDEICAQLESLGLTPGVHSM